MITLKLFNQIKLENFENNKHLLYKEEKKILFYIHFYLTKFIEVLNYIYIYINIYKKKKVEILKLEIILT